MTESEILKILAARLMAHNYNKSALAREFGVTPGYMNEIMAGTRKPGCPAILKKLGLTKVVDFK